MSELLEMSLDKHLKAELARTDVTDICINQPGSVFIKTYMGWQPEIKKPELTFAVCKELSRYIAANNRRRIDHEKSLLSAILPTGERVYIVQPPSCDNDTMAFAIRKPSSKFRTFVELTDDGLFDVVCQAPTSLRPHEEELLSLSHAFEKAFAEGRVEEGRRLVKSFFPLAVKEKTTMLLSGATGSGKTTLQNAVLSLIDSRERLISMEDAREIRFPNHPNHVHLKYETDGGESAIGMTELLKGSLRMIPDRIILGELRGAEAWDYAMSTGSDHPGAVTTIHGKSANGAIMMLMARMRQHKDCGENYTDTYLRHLILQQIDLIVQFKFIKLPDGREIRRVTELKYDPERKYKEIM